MSETNPAPTTVPPSDPPAPAPPAPTPPPEPAPPPAPSGNPDMHGLMSRLETVLQGLPERTANAVREVSPQHVPNPTQPTPGNPQNPTPPPGENPAGKTTGGPSRFAKWFYGIKS